VQIASEDGPRPPRHRVLGHPAAALMVACLVGTPVMSAVAEGSDAAAASASLYADMSARNLPGVLRFIPAPGFTEISPDSSQVRRLDAKAFDALFKSQLLIDLHMEGMQVQALGDVTVVTGTRIGSITVPGTVPAEERQLATLVWSMAGDQWKLQHIHLSTPPAVK